MGRTEDSYKPSDWYRRSAWARKQRAWMDAECTRRLAAGELEMPPAGDGIVIAPNGDGPWHRTCDKCGTHVQQGTWFGATLIAYVHDSGVHLLYPVGLCAECAVSEGFKVRP